MKYVLILCLALISGLIASKTFGTSPLSHRDDLTVEDRQRVYTLLSKAIDFTKPKTFEAMSGGAATSLASVGQGAFSHGSANLSFEGQRDFKLGNGIFKKIWVSSPSSTQSSDGLGPLFNARSCQRCHLKDGRGHPPEGPDDVSVSMFLRLSVPPRTDAEREALANKTALLIPEPTYGGQLQDLAVPGLPAEGRMTIEYAEIPVPLSGGETASLRRPTYGVADLGYGPLDPDTILSPRVAPQMIGLGLLEAIHPGDIMMQADPDDMNNDGISGKASEVLDPLTGKIVLGRFGLKASTPGVHVQSAGAFADDIGISNSLADSAYGDCTDRQLACLEMPTGAHPDFGPHEVNDELLDLVVFYSKNLAVPKRRDVDHPEVLKGKKVFHESGCASCHTPSYVTSRNTKQSEHQFQLIWPYTDMLLHDMGDGLADGQTAGDATGNEWRTAPLWGIGLTEVVNGHTYFLHDGRARSLLEAILWHGGEAQTSRDQVVKMSPDDRAALVRFLESL